MIRYIKLYESFREDFKKKMKEIQEIKNNFILGMKREIDEYMSYILDEYQENSDSDDWEIIIGNFRIKYENIVIPFEKLQSDFMPLFEKVIENIENDLELEVTIIGFFVYLLNGEEKIHNLNYGHQSSIRELEIWLREYNNTNHKQKTSYKNLELTIIVH
jgi:predicted transcriptional regulator